LGKVLRVRVLGVINFCWGSKVGSLGTEVPAPVGSRSKVPVVVPEAEAFSHLIICSYLAEMYAIYLLQNLM